MALSDMQLRQLRAKLDARHIRTRKANGTDLHYVEGWHVISEANRIFGYDAWDRRTVATKCVSSSGNGQHHFAAYTAKVRITVRAGDIIIVREGSGTGEGSGLTPGQAHEIALKSAETDATKRALATFGNPFGLALYDREQLGIRKRRDFRARPALGPWVVRSESGAERLSFNKPSEFATALRTAMSEARDIEMLFALWEQNVETVRAINRTLGQQHLQKLGIAPQLVAHLKQCAVALAKNTNATQINSTQSTSTQQQLKSAALKIDKSVLPISQPRRVRNKEHLRYVASQPCAVCGRTPSHAHHVRYAQPRGLGLKVSDEFTVPLCATHHHHLHDTTREREWWLERKIDPLIIARALWQQSQKRLPDATLAVSSQNTLTVATAHLDDRPIGEDCTSPSSDEKAPVASG
jgi:Rad52/22 family double-strand break repair protein